MLSKRVDLHVHTSESDSSVSPRGVVKLAKEAGLSAIAITDHDTILGFEEAADAGMEFGVEVIPGIEFSTRYNGMVHILGYCIDTTNAELLQALDDIIKDRDTRNKKIVDQMRADGIDISYDEMMDRFGLVIGRPHFAQILVENGMAESVKDAFNRLVGKNMRYWAPRTTVPIERCIELILNAGGVPFIAHPFEYGYDKEKLVTLVHHCLSHGAKGIEVRHPSHTKQQMEHLERLISESPYDVLMSGGSDFHGDVKPNNLLGIPEVPYEWLEKIKAASKNY